MGQHQVIVIILQTEEAKCFVKATTALTRYLTQSLRVEQNFNQSFQCMQVAESLTIWNLQLDLSNYNVRHVRYSSQTT